MRRRLPALALLVVLAACTARPAAAGSRRCEALERGERIRIDLRDVPLERLTRLVSCATELRVLFAPSDLAGERVTVVAPRPVGADGLLGLLHVALDEAGLVAEQRGAYLRVRPAGQGAQRSSKRRSRSGR